MANSNSKKNGELTREQLVAAAVELNKEIMPHPPINVATEDVGLLKGQIMEAAGIIVPDDDEITPETQHVIDTLEAQDMVPTIEGKPQQAAEPATEPTSTEPKEEDKTEDKEELVKLIKAAERIKDLKGIVESSPTFKALRKKMAEGLYRVQDGLTLLKREMLEAMGYEQDEKKPAKGNGNGKKKTEDKKVTKPKKPAKPKKEKTPPRANVIFDCINSKWATAEEVCGKANQKMIEFGGKDNIKQTLHIFKTQFPLMAYAGLIIIEGDKVKLA